MSRTRSLATLVASIAIVLSLFEGIAPARAATVPGSTYFPVTPSRLLDTRTSASPLGPGASRDLTVVGVGGVPLTGVSAVVLNVTATDATAADSFLTVYPGGTTRPVASNLNVTAGRTSTNLVKVAVPTTGDKAGKVTIYNNLGSVSVVADVNGWYSVNGGAVGSTYAALPPSRVLDTRTGLGGTSGAVFGGQTIDLTLHDRAGVPASGVSAVVLNVTAIHAGGPESFLTVFPSATLRPLASNLNFVNRQVVPNLVVARLGTNGKVSIYNNMGLAHIVADVEGFYFAPGATITTGGAGTYVPLPPARDLDTRNGVGTGGTIGKMGPGQTLDLTVTGVNGVPATGVSAVVLNVTAIDHAGPDTFLSVFPTGTARVGSNLNVVSGQSVPNLVVVPVGAFGRVSIYNNLGSVHVAADVQGWFLNSGV